MKTLIAVLFTLIAFQLQAQHEVFVYDSSGIYSIDLNNCTKRFIGKADLGFADLAFTPDGKLWAITKSGDLYLVDPLNADTTYVGDTKVASTSLEALNDSTLLIEFFKKLYAVRVKDASIQDMGLIGDYSAGDLSWYKDTLYMQSSGSGIVTIELSENSSSIKSTGRKPYISTFWGLSTFVFSDGRYALIGFDDSSKIYEICPGDWSSTIICPDLLNDIPYGAASTRLEGQYFRTCGSLFTSSEQQQMMNFEIYPNPVLNMLNTSHLEDAEFIIYDNMGQIHEATFYLNQIDVTHLDPGTYILKLIQEDRIGYSRFIKI